MGSDSTDADPKSLPRSFRGYNRQATEELFRRVAWDYGVLAGEHRKLQKIVEEMTPPARRKSDLIEDAHAVLAAAQKAARELRESARAECEQALKKAKGRAAELEAEANRAAGDAGAVLAGAATLRATLQDALRRFESEEPLPQPAPVQAAEPETVLDGASVVALDPGAGLRPRDVPDRATAEDRSVASGDTVWP